MLYSIGVSETSSPPCVTRFCASSSTMSRQTRSSGRSDSPPSSVYRRSCDLTRASTSMGLKGFVT